MGWALPWGITQQTDFCFTVPSKMLGFWLGFFSVQTTGMGKWMLNRADSFLMTKLWTQTDEVQGSSNLQTRVVCCNIQPQAKGKRKHLHVENAVKSRYLLIHFPDLS